MGRGRQGGGQQRLGDWEGENREGEMERGQWGGGDGEGDHGGSGERGGDGEVRGGEGRLGWGKRLGGERGKRRVDFTDGYDGNAWVDIGYRID